MKMVHLINHNGIRIKIVLLFIITIIFCQMSIHHVVADETNDGPLAISEGDVINIQCGTSYTLSWQFQVDTNERAIYWEIIGYNVVKSGWGPNANCTTPVLNETGTTYEYVCHGYYAKYHVQSTIIFTCTKTGQVNGGGNEGFDPIIILYIGVPIILVSGIGLIIVIYLRRKKKQDFF